MTSLYISVDEVLGGNAMTYETIAIVSIIATFAIIGITAWLVVRSM